MEEKTFVRGFSFLVFFADFYKSLAEGGEHPAAKVMPNKPPGLEKDAPSRFLQQPQDPTKSEEFVPTFPLPHGAHDEEEGVN